MHRLLALAVLVAVLALPAAPASATSKRYCSFQGLSKASWTVNEVQRTIRCFAWHLGVDVNTALYVAGRESGFRPRAFNPSGCAGVYQHQLSYWDARVRAYSGLLERFKVRNTAWWNPRANILVAMGMVRDHGWSAWGL